SSLENVTLDSKGTQQWGAARGDSNATPRHGSLCKPWDCLCLPRILSGRIRARKRIGSSSIVILALLHLMAILVRSLFKSRSRLEAENLFLRHQLNIALRQAPPPSTVLRL